MNDGGRGGIRTSTLGCVENIHNHIRDADSRALTGVLGKIVCGATSVIIFSSNDIISEMRGKMRSAGQTALRCILCKMQQ